MALRFRIGTKIFALAVFLLGLTVALSAFGALRTAELLAAQRRISDFYVPLNASLESISDLSLEQQLDFEQLLDAINDEGARSADVARLKENIQDSRSRAVNFIADAESLFAKMTRESPDFTDLSVIKTLFDEAKADSKELTGLQDQMLDPSNLRNRAVERVLRPPHNRVRAKLNDCREHTQTRISDLIQNATGDAERKQADLVAITLSVTGAAVAAGLLFAWLVTRKMVQPVQTLMAGVQNVEKGDLTVNLPVRSTDEIGVLTAYFNRLVGELRSKERMKETFGKYIDPRIVEKVIGDTGTHEVQVGRRVMTISFCDLVGFTGIGEHLTPSGVVRMLNRHFEYMAGAIHQHQGVVDKFMGDAVMAFWGPPFTAECDHATLACRAALTELDVLEKLCAELPELTGLRKNVPILDLRIGLASGDVVVGNIGAESARAYTVIGDTVNLASRLESVNRLYETRILLSGETRRLAGDAIEAREVDLIAVKGKSEPAVVYELLGLAGTVAENRLTARDRYQEGLAAYRKFEWAAAETALRGVLELFPLDGPSRLLLSRIPQLQAAPPAPGWDGVWHMVEK